MIEKFVKIWHEKNHLIRQKFSDKHPGGYEDIVRAVIEILSDEDDYLTPDPKRIHTIDDGHYQGMLVYVIACQGYQPSTYWYVTVWYGSCSGCDTLQGISGYDDGNPTDKQIDKYMTLALHILQGLKQMDDNGC